MGGMSRQYSTRSGYSQGEYSVYSSQIDSEDASLYDRSVYDRDGHSHYNRHRRRGDQEAGDDDISYAQSYARSAHSMADRSVMSRRSRQSEMVDQVPHLDYIDEGMIEEEDGGFNEEDGGEAEAPPPTLYDLFFDLAHPAASPGCPRARVIDSPSAAEASGVGGPEVEAADAAARAVMDELFDPSNISRIARFAFPEHDDELHAAEVAEMRLNQQQQRQQQQQQMASDQTHNYSTRSNLTGVSSGANSAYADDDYDEGMSLKSASAVPPSANLNRYDMYLKSFHPQSHTFTLQLADGTRIHGHVRRYLPTHTQAVGRSDVGRRGARAMVLLTRATGGERFYSALLKTVEALYMERDGIDTELAPDEIPARTFLHALHNHHSRLTQEARDIIAQGGTLNYSAGGDGQSAAESAKAFMWQNENLFRVALSGLEFGGYGSLDDMDPQTGQLGRLNVSGDAVRLRLPPSLQPGYEATHTCTVEDLHSPILPLLRCLGAPHTLRLLSALLCENRIILVSKSASRLSTCVRAASAMLAQGLLVWRHVQIPVLPPHLLKYLTSDSPYLIGLLEQFASNLDVLPMMQSVLCVNLDWNEMRTYNMPNAASSIPDLLKPVRRARTADDVFSPAEFLAKDMADVLKNDRSVWGGMTGGRTGGASNVGAPPGGALVGTSSGSEDGGTVSNNSGQSSAMTKKSFMSMMTPLTGMLGLKNRDEGRLATNGTASITSSNKHMDEAQKTADMAAFMGSVMRNARNPALKNQLGAAGGARGKNVRGGDGEDDISSVGDDMSIHGDRTYMNVPQNDRALAKDAGLLPGFFAVEAEGACENERAEEEVRAAFTCFYLYIFGDMGMYLSEAEDGSLWLDRKKFLLRKKQMGDRESSTMFAVCLSLSRSLMFESFVRGRIADLERPTIERAKMMPHHIPLFVYCEKYLRINRLKFTMANIRRVVSSTVLSCPQHTIVDETEAIRTMALALTSNEPFKGNVVVAVEKLVSDCREVNSALPQVIAVIWARMAEARATYWRHPLLALHLLKNLILHGPLTAIAEATDGIEKVRALQTFTSKNSASAREVQLVAKQLFALLTDRHRLFFKRRRAGIERTYHPKTSIDTLRWSDYLVRRLPITVGFRNMHVLLRPNESGLPSARDRDDAAGANESVVSGLLSVDRLPDQVGEEEYGEAYEQDYTQEEAEEYEPALASQQYDEEKEQVEYDGPEVAVAAEGQSHPAYYSEDAHMDEVGEGDYNSLAQGGEDQEDAQEVQSEEMEQMSSFYNSTMDIEDGHLEEQQQQTGATTSTDRFGRTISTDSIAMENMADAERAYSEFQEGQEDHRVGAVDSQSRSSADAHEQAAELDSEDIYDSIQEVPIRNGDDYNDGDVGPNEAKYVGAVDELPLPPDISGEADSAEIQIEDNGVCKGPEIAALNSNETVLIPDSSEQADEDESQGRYAISDNPKEGGDTDMKEQCGDDIDDITSDNIDEPEQERIAGDAKLTSDPSGEADEDNMQRQGSGDLLQESNDNASEEQAIEIEDAPQDPKLNGDATSIMQGHFEDDSSVPPNLVPEDCGHEQELGCAELGDCQPDLQGNGHQVMPEEAQPDVPSGKKKRRRKKKKPRSGEAIPGQEDKGRMNGA